MITVIHGENIQQSRNFYFAQKQKSGPQVTLEGQSFTLTDLAQALSGGGLFDEKTSVFIDDFFSKRKKSKDRDNLVEFLRKKSANSEIILWESKTLTASEIKNLGPVDEKKFDFPKEIFAFLESIVPGNSINTIQNFHKTIRTEEPEFVFFMIVRHFRILLGLTEDSENKIDEVKRLAPWQIKKLTVQKEKLGKEKLLALYKDFFEIEKGLKTGKMSAPLENSIDFLLSTL